MARTVTYEELDWLAATAYDLANRYGNARKEMFDALNRRAKFFAHQQESSQSHDNLRQLVEARRTDGDVNVETIDAFLKGIAASQKHVEDQAAAAVESVDAFTKQIEVVTRYARLWIPLDELEHCPILLSGEWRIVGNHPRDDEGEFVKSFSTELRLLRICFVQMEAVGVEG